MAAERRERDDLQFVQPASRVQLSQTLRGGDKPETTVNATIYRVKP